MMAEIPYEPMPDNRRECCKDVANWCCGCGECQVCFPQHNESPPYCVDLMADEAYAAGISEVSIFLQNWGPA